MALNWQAAASPSTDAASPMTVNLTASAVAGDLLIVVIGMKPSVASSGSVATPAGWTSLGSHVGGGYGATLGADTGNTHLFVFYQVLSGAPPISQNFTLTNANATWGQCYQLRATSGSYDLAMAVGEDTSAGNVSIAFTSNPGVTSGDIVIGAMCIPTDVTTPTQFSAQALTQTGITFSAVTEIGEYDSVTGNDIGGFACRASVTAGTGSANPTMTATAGGTTTNVRGPGVFIRVRETTPSTSPIAGSTAGVATVTGTLTAKGKLTGSAAGTATITATLKGKGALVGSAQGSATVTGTLSSVAGPGAIAGSAQGTSTASGTLRAKGKLSGSIACAATTSGALRGKGKLTGTSQGVATSAATIRAKGKLTGSCAGVATVVASLSATGKLVGSSTGVATASGSLKGRGALQGSIIGTCTAIGILKGTGRMIGITAGTSFVSGRMVQPAQAASMRGVRLSLTNRVKV